MKKPFVCCVFFTLAVLGAARAEWKSEPPEVMAGGEIIGQFYHLFSGARPPHRVWVKYQDKIYFCRGESKSFQCQETEASGTSSAAAGPDNAPVQTAP